MLFPHILRCMPCEREPGKQETEAIGFELKEKDWDMLANAGLDKVQLKCFQQQKCKSCVGITSHEGQTNCAWTAAVMPTSPGCFRALTFPQTCMDF